VRIISGTFKGRRLRGPKGMDVRPTSDRLRQTLFDILGTRVPGSVFLDGFAGTGSVGLEAISRGAREVVFIESAPESVKLIRQNLSDCGVRSGYRILQRDIFMALRELARQRFRPDTVYFDPPYDWEPYRDLLSLTFSADMVQPQTLAIIEHRSKSQLPDQEGGGRRFRTVAQGDKGLSFYLPEAGPPDAL
jgi:16S rRNA (guanine966-N2)-methyltransferase